MTRRRSRERSDDALGEPLAWLDGQIQTAGMTYTQLATSTLYDRWWISRAL
jgi:hypothetical protein